jgi:hypothetical protein
MDDTTTVGISNKQKFLIRLLLLDILPPIFKSLKVIRSCLPVQPWMARAVGTISVLGMAGLIWAASALVGDIKADIKENAQETAATKAKCSELQAEIRPLRDGVVDANASLRILLRSRGLSEPSRSDLEASRLRLGFKPDSTGKDSAQHGPHNQED